MSELREKVAISLRCAELWRDMDGVGTLDTYGIDNRECEKLADAAIAAVLEAMQEPSETMLAAVVNEPTHLYGMDGRGAEYERDMKNAFAIDRLVKRQEWQDMLDAFKRENDLPRES